MVNAFWSTRDARAYVLYLYPMVGNVSQCYSSCTTRPPPRHIVRRVIVLHRAVVTMTITRRICSICIWSMFVGIAFSVNIFYLYVSFFCVHCGGSYIYFLINFLDERNYYIQYTYVLLRIRLQVVRTSSCLTYIYIIYSVQSICICCNKTTAKKKR